MDTVRSKKRKGSWENIKKKSLPRMEKWRVEKFFRLDRARGDGLKSMHTQAVLTAIAVNLKRIAKVLSSKSLLSKGNSTSPVYYLFMGED